MDVGLRELRQQASDLVRRAEAGETVTVTVSGRIAARLVPADRDTWRSYADIAGLFRGCPDTGWAVDRDRVDGDLVDPWARR